MVPEPHPPRGEMPYPSATHHVMIVGVETMFSGNTWIAKRLRWFLRKWLIPILGVTIMQVEPTFAYFNHNHDGVYAPVDHTHS